MNWPIGTDGDFKGIYNRNLSQVELYRSEAHGQAVSSAKVGNVRDESFRQALGDDKYEKLCGDIDLLDVAGDKFDMDSVLSGELTPMFFGSAMTNFGVQTFLDEFLTMAPSPGKRETQEGAVLPCDEEFSGFVFKIQANMDPNHRDRIAFLRICSGKYEKGMEVSHSGTGKVIKLAQSQQFFAKDREEVTEAYAGDIIGVFDPGIFGIGDTLYTGKKPIRFEGIPVFPAEHFAKVTAKDTSKRKQFLKGIKQISEEGAIQVFKQPDIGVEAFVIGVVGVLQFEVLEYRLKSEYGAEINVERLPFAFARWVMTDRENIGSTMMGYIDSAYLVEDAQKRPVILYRDQWTLRNAVEKNKDVKFLEMPPAV
jgi:peptide chain release factor 3